MGKFIDFTGLKFENLKVERRVGTDGRGEILYEVKCQCGCGQSRNLRAQVLRYRFDSPGRAKCLGKREGLLTKDLGTLKAVWASMLQRCLNPVSPNFKRYGARGITVSEEWKDFEKFVEDMGIPEKGQQLERKDNNLGYSKENCKWASAKEQARNRRSNVVLTHNGVSKILIEWCEELNLDYNAVQLRIQRGWNTERALTTKTPKPFRPK